MISQLIRKYQEHGIMLELRSKWLSSACVSSEKSDQGEANEIGTSYFGGLFTMVLGWAVFSVIIFSFEIIVHKLYSLRSYPI